MAVVFQTSIEPDAEELLRVLLRRGRPRRVHFIELFLDEEIREVLSGRFGIGTDLDRADPLFGVKRDVRLHAALGYDIFRVHVIRKSFFDMLTLPARDTTAIASQRRGDREWQEEHRGPIQSMKDFEEYRWPSISEIDFSAVEWLEKNLPRTMGCYDLTAHVFEMVSFLLGYEELCYKVADDPALVDALCEKIGTFYVDYTRVLADFPCMPVIWGSDDLGFRSSTMMSPAFLRQKILPWHRRCAEIAHAKGKPYLLHSCGNLDAIMDDLVDVVGIDGRHSFEDAILPVTEAKKRYGAKVAILGGIDVDFLCRADERAVRERVRQTLDLCARDTGYCLGTGNTVANYLPVANYLAMLDEGRRYRL